MSFEILADCPEGEKRFCSKSGVFKSHSIITKCWDWCKHGVPSGFRLVVLSESDCPRLKESRRAAMKQIINVASPKTGGFMKVLQKHILKVVVSPFSPAVRAFVLAGKRYYDALNGYKKKFRSTMRKLKSIQDPAMGCAVDIMKRLENELREAESAYQSAKNGLSSSADGREILYKLGDPRGQKKSATAAPAEAKKGATKAIQPKKVSKPRNSSPHGLSKSEISIRQMDAFKKGGPDALKREVAKIAQELDTARAKKDSSSIKSGKKEIVTTTKHGSKKAVTMSKYGPKKTVTRQGSRKTNQHKKAPKPVVVKVPKHEKKKYENRLRNARRRGGKHAELRELKKIQREIALKKHKKKEGKRFQENLQKKWKAEREAKERKDARRRQHEKKKMEAYSKAIDSAAKDFQRLPEETQSTLIVVAAGAGLAALIGLSIVGNEDAQQATGIIGLIVNPIVFLSMGTLFAMEDKTTNRPIMAAWLGANDFHSSLMGGGILSLSGCLGYSSISPQKSAVSAFDLFHTRSTLRWMVIRVMFDVAIATGGTDGMGGIQLTAGIGLQPFDVGLISPYFDVRSTKLFADGDHKSWAENRYNGFELVIGNRINLNGLWGGGKHGWLSPHWNTYWAFIDVEMAWGFGLESSAGDRLYSRLSILFGFKGQLWKPY